MKKLDGPRALPLSGNVKKLVVFLHGLGADGNDLISLADEFADVLPDTGFVSPNAPFPCDMAPYGYQWFSLMDRTPSKVLAGVQVAAPILNQFLDELLAEYKLKAGDAALVGFSQGTMMSLYTALRRPEAVAGILGYSGAMIGGELLKDELKSKPPVCLIHGDADGVVPYEAMAMAEGFLKQAGVPLETHTAKGLGHGIDGPGIMTGKAFLKRVLAQ